MINWEKIEDTLPSNVGKAYFGSSETPFVTCIVWCCNPNFTHGGIARTVRWDTEKKCWYEADMRHDWVFHPPYEITHYCDEINTPST